MKLLSLATLTSVALATTLASTAAFAAKSNTEYYFQPAAGANAVELRYNMFVQPKQTETGGTTTDAKVEINDFNLNYAYGLNESNTLGIYLFTGSAKTTNGAVSNTATGLGDIHLFYEGSAEMWHYGVDVGVNTEKIKVDASNNISNRSTGGITIMPWVGVMMNASSWNYGAQLSYLAKLDRTYDVGNTTITEGNEIKLAPFAEYNYGMGFLGAELSYNMVADSKINTGNVTKKGESVTGLNAYGSFDFNDMATGLLTLGMAMHPEHDETAVAGTKVKAYTETIASLGVRLNF